VSVRGGKAAYLVSKAAAISALSNAARRRKTVTHIRPSGGLLLALLWQAVINRTGARAGDKKQRGGKKPIIGRGGGKRR